jgi:hypothetical protein
MLSESFQEALTEESMDKAEAVLSDGELGDIHAFLMLLPGRRPAKDFPTLNQ